MAESGGSKGKGKAPTTPPAKGKGGGGTRKSKTAPPPDGAPDRRFEMGWLAMRYDIPGTWNYNEVSIGFPVVSVALHEMGAPEDHNTLIIPRPAGLIEGLVERWPQACAPGKGKLPDLVLHPVKAGNNQAIWSEYLAAHPARSVEVETWGKPIHLPKG